MKTCHVKSGSFDPIERASEPVNGQPSSDYSKTFQKTLYGVYTKREIAGGQASMPFSSLLQVMTRQGLKQVCPPKV
jgi:hypothetical protein